MKSSINVPSFSVTIQDSTNIFIVVQNDRTSGVLDGAVLSTNVLTMVGKRGTSQRVSLDWDAKKKMCEKKKRNYRK